MIVSFRRAVVFSLAWLSANIWGDIAYISWGEDFIAKCSFVYYLSRLFCTKYFYMKLIFSEDVYDRIFKRIVICSNFRPVLKKKT